jgi:hypothetical protein
MRSLLDGAVMQSPDGIGLMHCALSPLDEDVALETAKLLYRVTRDDGARVGGGGGGARERCRAAAVGNGERRRRLRAPEPPTPTTSPSWRGAATTSPPSRGVHGDDRSLAWHFAASPTHPSPIFVAYTETTAPSRVIHSDRCVDDDRPFRAVFATTNDRSPPPLQTRR